MSQRFTSRLFRILRKKMKPYRVGDFLFLSVADRYRHRLSVVAKKKIFPHAVDRNRYRRIVYELFRHSDWQTIRPRSIICLYQGQAEKFSRKNAEAAIIKSVDFFRNADRVKG